MSWEANVRKVVPYTPGEQPKIADITKLNTNENPYPPAPSVQEILDTFDIALMRKYPDPNAQILVDALAKYYGVNPEQVFVGVGSDDVISMAFMTFFNGDKPVLFPDVTYSFYDVWADVYRIPYQQIPLTEDFRIDPKDYARENGGIIFPNPNAPTGVLESLETVEEILKANASLDTPSLTPVEMLLPEAGKELEEKMANIQKLYEAAAALNVAQDSFFINFRGTQETVMKQMQDHGRMQERIEKRLPILKQILAGFQELEQIDSLSD